MYRATSIDSAGTSNNSTSTTADATEFDGKWVPIVCKFTSDSSRRIYINTRTHIADVTDTSTRTVVVGDLRYIRIGCALSANSAWGNSLAPDYSLISEVAIWNSTLSDADIDSFMGGGITTEAGTSAYLIDNANLLFYNPLRSATPNDDALQVGPDVTATGTVTHVSADHPTITYSLTAKYLKILPCGPVPPSSTTRARTP